MTKPVYGPPIEALAPQAEAAENAPAEIVVTGQPKAPVTSLNHIASFAGRKLGINDGDVPKIVQQIGGAFLGRVESGWSLKRDEIEQRTNPKPPAVLPVEPTISIKSMRLPVDEKKGLFAYVNCGVVMEGFHPGGACTLNFKATLGGPKR